jgi:hypothetical protein
MASIILDLFAVALELAFWVIWWALPTVLYFTALALLFVATFGKIRVELPERMTRVGWTGLLQIRRSNEGRMIVSPALGVIVGFVIWTVVASAMMIYYAYRSQDAQSEACLSRPRRDGGHGALWRAFAHPLQRHALNQPCASPVKEK